MKPISCIRNGFLIDKRAAGLSHSERLRLEEHLSTCDACSREAKLLTTLGDLISTVESPITPIERNRAIRRALDLPYGSAVRPERKRFVAALAAAALSAAVVAAWALFLQPEDAAKPVTVIQPKRVETDADRVLSGEVATENQTIRAGSALKRSGLFESRKRSRIMLGRAEVELRANTRIKWRKSESTIELVEGSVLTEVERRTGSRFRVVTEGFMVEVLGTRFEVDSKGVKVHRGTVRILARDGKSVIATLSAPESWRLQPPIAEEQERKSSKKPVSVAKRTVPKASCRTLLKRARSFLANDKPAEAAVIIQTALMRSPTRSDRAEAASLQAEYALIQGDLATAVATYRTVASRYKGLPAAENALFAAARIETTRGKKAEAIVLLERYLREFPNGRFRKDVVRRLRALGRL